jgi:hypothetical protein
METLYSKGKMFGLGRDEGTEAWSNCIMKNL